VVLDPVDYVAVRNKTANQRNEPSRGTATGEVTGIRIVRAGLEGAEARWSTRSPLGRLLIRLLDGEVDFVSISSMARMRAPLSASGPSWLKVRSRFRRSDFIDN